MPRPKKESELTPTQKFAKELDRFEEQNRSYEETVPKCEHCGGRPGYNPVTGIELRKGHFSTCLTLQDRRAMVTTFNTSL